MDDSTSELDDTEDEEHPQRNPTQDADVINDVINREQCSTNSSPVESSTVTDSEVGLFKQNGVSHSSRLSLELQEITRSNEANVERIENGSTEITGSSASSAEVDIRGDSTARVEDLTGHKVGSRTPQSNDEDQRQVKANSNQ